MKKHLICTFEVDRLMYKHLNFLMCGMQTKNAMCYEQTAICMKSLEYSDSVGHKSFCI